MEGIDGKMIIKFTKDFIDSVEAIKDRKLAAIIAQRTNRLSEGYFGDTKSIGDGVSEIRIHYGSGYRLYYTIRGQEIVVLLCSGEKSDQKKNIKLAKKLAKEV